MSETGASPDESALATVVHSRTPPSLLSVIEILLSIV